MLWPMLEPRAAERPPALPAEVSRSNHSPNAVAGRLINPAELHVRLARVRLLLCDVDGILTDGTVFMGGGVEYKRYGIRDGLGLRLLQKCGVKVGWVSARPSESTRQRAEDLKVDFLIQSAESKVLGTQRLLDEHGFAWEDVAFMGDDVVDLGMLRRAGLAISVPDGIAEARTLAHYVTRAAAGNGAVREVAELILKAQGKWAGLVTEFSA